MTFLNPALLFGLIASAIPILIHLFNKRKLEKIEFSTLAFLKELQKTKIRKIKLKQWILLILRTLIIILLVGAFARPAVKSVSSTVAYSTAKTTGVFLIDDTPSMAIAGSKGSYLSRALHLAEDALENYLDGDEIIIINLSEPDNREVFSSPYAARKYLDKIILANTGGNFEKAFANAVNLLKASNNINKELYLFSDMQRTTINSKLLDSANTESFDDINFYIATLGKNEIANKSLVELKTSNQIFELNKEIELRIKAKGGSRESTVSVFINGIRAAQKRIHFDGGNTVTDKLNVTLKQTGLLEIKASLESDQFSYDNYAYTALLVPPVIKLGIIYSSPKDYEFLKLALSPEAGKTLDIKEIAWERINSFNLMNFDALILSGVKNANNFANIVKFVNSGRGLIVFPGGKESLEAFNRLAAELSLPSAARMIKSEKDASINSFDKADYEHPLFTDLFGEKNRKLESPEIFKFIKFKDDKTVRKIISLKDGSFFLCEKLNRGKTLLFNTMPNLEWSSFPLTGLFAPIIYKAVRYAAQPSAKEDNRFVGSPVAVDISNAAIPVLEVITPRNEKEKFDIKKATRKKFIYKGTETPGVYKFINNGKIIDYAVLNVLPDESDLTYLTWREAINLFTAKRYKFNFIRLQENADVQSVISQSRFGAELWKWLIMGAFFLAIIEMLISKNNKKELMSLKHAGIS